MHGASTLPHVAVGGAVQVELVQMPEAQSLPTVHVVPFAPGTPASAPVPPSGVPPSAVPPSGGGALALAQNPPPPSGWMQEEPLQHSESAVHVAPSSVHVVPHLYPPPAAGRQGARLQH